MMRALVSIAGLAMIVKRSLLMSEKIIFGGLMNEPGNVKVKEMWILSFGIVPVVMVACKIRRWRLERQEQEDLDKFYFTPNPPLFGQRLVN